MNHAVSVGYARHLVAWLFSLWPKAKRITKTFLNNIDASKVVGLLDLIQEAEHKEHFEKVIFLFTSRESCYPWVPTVSEILFSFIPLSLFIQLSALFLRSSLLFRFSIKRRVTVR